MPTEPYHIHLTA